jgi:hypothetical protein
MYFIYWKRKSGSLDADLAICITWSLAGWHPL